MTAGISDLTREILAYRFGANWNDVINFVPDEVCVVVEGPGLTETPPQLLQPLIQRQLNALVRELVCRPFGDTKEAFALDTAPVSLQRLYPPNGVVLGEGLLRPVRRPEGTIPPLIFSPPATVANQPAPRRALLFFQVGPERLPARATYDREALNLHANAVRELTLGINQNLKLLATDGLIREGYRVIAVTPNWLQVAAPQTCGSPAGRPLPVAGQPAIAQPLIDFGDTSFQAQARSAAQAARNPRGVKPSNVVVAVLDTCPDLKPIPSTAEGAKRKAWLDHLAEINWLFRQVRERASFDAPPSLPPAALAHLQPILPNWNGPENSSSMNLDDFQMADHGLFVTGIVDHLAPEAEVHLVRVLNDVGVGDLASIAHVVQELPKLLLTSRDKRLVVNLSLGTDMPPECCEVARWFPLTAGSPLALDQHRAEITSLLDLSRQSLATIFSILERDDVVVVAAVGNDMLPGDSQRQAPRYPAHFDSVLGVAALKGDGWPADYTNLGDERTGPRKNGVATFGGNATLTGNYAGPRVTAGQDAVVGIFTAESFPFQAGANETGWARWSGTSFAAPIITALIAQEWARDTSRSASAIVARVLSRATAGVGGLEAPSIQAKSSF